MKVLVVYGGPNNGFKREFAKQQTLSSQTKATNVQNLTLDNQFFISTIKNIMKN